MGYSLADTFKGRITLTVIAVLLTIANSVVVIVYSFNKRLRSFANRFVLSLAIGDLIVSCILVPLMAWDPLNPAVGAITSFSLWASLTNICGCTYDRFNAIKNPLLYASIMTKKRFIYLMIAIWTVPFIFAIIPQIWLLNLDALKMSPEEAAKAIRIYVGFMTITILVICVVLFAVYIYIFRVAKKHYDSIRRMEPPKLSNPGPAEPDTSNVGRKSRVAVKKFFSTIKSTTLFAIIGFNFLLCWLPLIIINLFLAFDLNHMLSLTFVNVAEIFMYANSLLNPIAYAFFQKEFRRAIGRFFCLPNAVGPSQSTYYTNTDRNTNAVSDQ